MARRTVWLIVLAGAALGVRVAAIVALAPPTDRPVTYEHGRIAENLLAGRGFTIEFLGQEGPTSQQAPFYPFLLAGLYAALGNGSPAAILTAQLLQAVAGAVLVIAIVRLAWSLLPDRPAAGWLAGVAAALYPTHVYAATHLQVALWAALGLTALLVVVSGPYWLGRWRGSLVAGALAGGLLLVEPILAVALPVAAAAFYFGSRGSMVRRLGQTATMAAVAATVVAPWIVRNARVHGELVFVKSTFGYAFWQANNPHSWGTDKIPKPTVEPIRTTHDGSLAGINAALWEARHETLYIDDVLLKPGGFKEFAGLSEPARSRLLGRRAWAFIRDNPGRYAGLCCRRLAYFLSIDPTNPKAANAVYRWATAVWLVLGGVGLLATVGRWRRLWPGYAVFAVVTLFHALVITSVRFRVPIEPLGLIWGAAALAPLVERLRPARWPAVHRPGTRAAMGHALAGPHRRPVVPSAAPVAPR